MTAYSWHEDFFKRKVFPQICKDAGECTGLFAWLQVGDRQLYDEILRLEGEMESLWKAKSDQESFRYACQAWYVAVMKGIGKWRDALSLVNGRVQEEKQQHQGPAQARLII